MASKQFVGFGSSLLAFASLCLVSGEAEARDWRPGQIPNGSRVPNGGNTCLTCHNGGGGGPRNSFGLAVQAIVSPGSTAQFWSAELAAMDSDGDGFTNGEELQDPAGAWRPGQPNPGTPALVTHPGNANSKPAQVATPTPTATPLQPTATPTLAATATPTSTPPLPASTPTPVPATPTPTPTVLTSIWNWLML